MQGPELKSFNLTSPYFQGLNCQGKTSQDYFYKQQPGDIYK